MADAKISALPAMSALAGTEVLTGVQSAINANATPAQIATYTRSYGQGSILIGYLANADFNVTTDQAITITLPPGFTRFRINAINIEGASISLTTAAGGFYSAAAKGGTAIVANTQVYTTLTAAAVNSTGSFMQPSLNSVSNTVWNLATIYFSLTTAQGAAATANISINGLALP